ncbi:MULTISPECIES: hypothetical protein [unclassified Pseudomonas]|uniref:hypothetical protein n=1 Tax=unclassified Pseudomonas TaxID=196821 RepID=UPI0009EA6E8E|nr:MULTISPECIES: hypothetical protein [unclassified Pseudomonas]
MMNIRMTSLLLAGCLSATSLATFAASGDSPGTPGTAPGATRNSTLLPDNNRPSAPSGNSSSRGPSSSSGTTGVNGPGSGAGGGTGAPGGGTGGAGGGTGSWTGQSRQ